MEKKNAINYFFLAALLSALSPYLWLSFFTHPIADDYCFSSIRGDKAFIEKFTHLFFNMGGRYTTNALLLVNPLAFHSISFYKIIPALQIVLGIFSFYYFFRSLTSRVISKIASLNASLLFILLYLYQMPSLPEGIYSYTPSVDYHTGIIAVLLYFGTLHDYHRKNYILHRFIHLGISLLLLILSIGFCEVLTLVLILFHPAVLFLFYRQGKKISGDWMLITGVCMAFAALMLLAPGNSIRSDRYSENHNFFLSLAFTGMQIFRFGFDWISSLALVLSVFLFCLIAVAEKEKIPFFREFPPLSPWISLMVLFVLLFLSIFPPYWSTNILGQHRTVNVGYFLFLLYCFIGAGIWACQYTERNKINFEISKQIKVVCTIFIVFIIMATKNGQGVFTDILYGKAEVFDIQMKQRAEILSRSENKGKTVYLRPLIEKPASLFVMDLSEDSAHWVNRCQARYFGVKGILCKE